ncbi:HAD family hydrolase [Peribacillus kribbensis]|uniref:HAD family hydrolase n=1 Tax=Peribacillus kribbensis TaxID=356658 RepID=UPI0004170F9D|nr:HAD family hydrolase [Peribacillus kribbensis]
MKKAVIFDLDETLLDRSRSLRAFITGQYRRFKMHFKDMEEQVYACRFIELDQRGYTGKDVVYKQLLKEYPMTAISWRELLDDYNTHFFEHCIPFPGLKETLNVLKKEGYALGIITNGRTGFQNRNIEALGIQDLMDVIVISEKEEVKKPDSAIFQRALALLQISSENVLFVGDHPKNDMEGASRAGLHTVWKDDGYYEDFSHPYTITDLSELPRLAFELIPSIKKTS